MTATTGDRLRNNLTGTMYKIKVIKGKLVVLETEDGSCQMLTERDSIKLFYEKIENVKKWNDGILDCWPTGLKN